MTEDQSRDWVEVAIVGAGHAGLCAAEALQRRAIVPTMFDHADRLGDVWRQRYDDLILNTRSDASAVPGVALPLDIGKWPGKDAWADHIENAATVLEVDRRATTVHRIEHDGENWLMTTDDGPVGASTVIVATGRNHRPVVPAWTGVEASSIDLWHASEFKCPGPLVGRRVLVVGAGNSGVEIANLCAAAGIETMLSMERRPVFARREFFGTDLTSAARRAKALPDRMVDLSGRVLQFLLFGRLRRWRIGPPEMRLSNVAEASGATLDSGFIAAVKQGRITVVDAVDHFDGAHVVTRTGLRLEVDVVVAATGYSPALGDLLPADTLDDAGWPRCRTAPWASAPGLYTAGLNPATLTAFHPDFITEADQIAADIAKRKHGARR